MQSRRATEIESRTRHAAHRLRALPTAEVVDWAIRLADELSVDRPFTLTIVGRELARPAVATYFAGRTRPDLPAVGVAPAERTWW